MLASIKKQQNHSIAIFTRRLPHSVDAVWAVLTENGKLEKWMRNLEVVDLRQNGIMRFHMNDGTNNFEDIAITDYVENEVIEFDWGLDTVRFELSPTAEGSLLVLKETIRTMTDHTSKDLAGWHVCLELLIDLLNDIIHEEFPMEEWKKCFAQYKIIVEQSN